MTSIRLDENHDIPIINGQIELISGAAEVQQRLIQEFRTFFGEWFLDTTRGVPWFEEILIKFPDPARVDSIFKSVILTEGNGVLELLSFDIDLDESTRLLNLTFQARTEEGIILFNEDFNL